MDAARVILLVDDEPDFREIFSVKLKKAGFDVIEASGGEDALKEVEIRSPDLILLDVKMPGMDGIQAFFKLKEKKEEKKVVFLTNFADPREEAVAVDEKFAKEMGAINYIKKTDDIDAIVSRVREIIAGQV